MDEVAKKCASCFVIDEDYILLVLHKKFGKYIQPGGHIENDEEPYQTAMREVLEETGIKVYIEDKIPFNIQTYNTKIGLQLDYQFIGKPINRNAIGNEESYSCGWFNINELDNIDVVDDLEEKILMIKSR